MPAQARHPQRGSNAWEGGTRHGAGPQGTCRGHGRAAYPWLGEEHAAVHQIKRPHALRTRKRAWSAGGWRGRCTPNTHNEEVTLGNKERGTKCAPRGLAEDIEGRSHPAWRKIRCSAPDKMLEGATECGGRRRCWYRPGTHNKEVTLDNKDRGAEHNPTGLVVDVQGRSRLGLAENMMQCI
ncbi:hypothetical protein NDU88_002239 [Pleurodeles waltl]|uniref:Uncharacterized protein n=1 Tax=Pleurodeles waltl TaxID=8319 RepID=A0AAV7WPM7_PLEWA|nr:hypothetical protein NDU88_002239 [Pleurodeles waltl]